MTGHRSYLADAQVCALHLARMYHRAVEERLVRLWAHRYPDQIPRRGRHGRRVLYDLREVQAKARELWGGPGADLPAYRDAEERQDQHNAAYRHQDEQRRVPQHRPTADEGQPHRQDDEQVDQAKPLPASEPPTCPLLRLSQPSSPSPMRRTR